MYINGIADDLSHPVYPFADDTSIFQHVLDPDTGGAVRSLNKGLDIIMKCNR